MVVVVVRVAGVGGVEPGVDGVEREVRGAGVADLRACGQGVMQISLGWPQW